MNKGCTLLLNVPQLIKPNKYIVCSGGASVGSHGKDLYVCVVHMKRFPTQNLIREPVQGHTREEAPFEERCVVTYLVCKNAFKYLLDWWIMSESLQYRQTHSVQHTSCPAGEKVCFLLMSLNSQLKKKTPKIWKESQWSQFCTL